MVMHCVAQCQLKLRKKRWLHNGKQTAASSMAHRESKCHTSEIHDGNEKWCCKPKILRDGKVEIWSNRKQISEGGKGCLNDQQRMEVNKTGG